MSTPEGIDPREAERVVRTFTDGRRIVAMPAKWSKKLVLLDLVGQSFEPGRAYAEKDVDAILRGWYAEDWVSLRRYLVDAAILDRRDGYYWRIGGTFDL